MAGPHPEAQAEDKCKEEEDWEKISLRKNRPKQEKEEEEGK